MPPEGFLLNGTGARTTGLGKGAVGKGFSSIFSKLPWKSVSTFSCISLSHLRPKKSLELVSEQLILCVPGNSKLSLSSLGLAPADMAQNRGLSSGVRDVRSHLFFPSTCSVGSSKPNNKLGPPPGGCKTWKLFLLLGSAPLKVTVVVMVPRDEGG